MAQKFFGGFERKAPGKRSGATRLGSRFAYGRHGHCCRNATCADGCKHAFLWFPFSTTLDMCIRVLVRSPWIQRKPFPSQSIPTDRRCSIDACASDRQLHVHTRQPARSDILGHPENSARACRARIALRGNCPSHAQVKYATVIEFHTRSWSAHQGTPSSTNGSAWGSEGYDFEKFAPSRRQGRPQVSSISQKHVLYAHRLLP